jgi:hypothetical protein
VQLAPLAFHPSGHRISTRCPPVRKSIAASSRVSNDTHQAQTTNHGAAGSNSIRAFLNGRAKVGMLRFDLAQLSGPVSDVQLQLQLTHSTRQRNWVIYGLNDDGLDAAATADNWGELSVTFANAPGFDQGASGVNTGNYVFNIGSDPGQVTSLVTMNVGATGQGVYTSPTSAALDAFINDAIASSNNNLVTLYISYDDGRNSTDTNPDWSFGAKEHVTAAPPTLIMVPEPAALSLLGIGGLGLMARRRR